MAVLSQKSGGGLRSYDIQALAPEGVYPARCIDIMDSPDVEEEKYGEPGVFVKKDKTRFLFAVKADNGTELVQTFEFNVSGSPKSRIVGFIKSWLGKPPPSGFDTCTLIGKVCQIVVAHRTSAKGTTYATIESIAPLMDSNKAPAEGSVEVPGGPRAETVSEDAPAAEPTQEAAGNGDPF